MPFPDGTEVLGDIPIAGQFFDKGGAVYNVMHPDFGAVGDGVTDDTAAIQAALDASGGTIYFPRGSYLASSNVTDGATVVISAGTTLDFSDGGGFLVTTSGEVSTDGPRYQVINNVGSGIVYGIFLITDASALDIAAALAVRNIGHADAIYVEVSGKPGTDPSSPTGIGIDVNKAAGASGESSTQNAGVGVFILDHSTTDQGVNGPHMILIRKDGNLNSGHPGIEILANKHAIRLLVDTSDVGYAVAEAILNFLDDDTGEEYWRFNADGKLSFIKTERGITFEFASGNAGELRWDKPGLTVDFIGGTNGIRVLDNAGSTVNAQFNEGGTLTLRVISSAPSSPVQGTLAYADGSGWDPGSGEGVYRFDGSTWVFLG